MLLLLVAVAGLTACITLIYLGMRAVMDVGGACADGGPYVSAQPCPDGTPAAMLLGVFGLFGFGALGMASGARIGGYGWLPLLAWTGLFATLGWNFLDYGLVNPPEGQGIEWGYVIPGVLFQLMAWVPVAFVLLTLRAPRGSSAAPGGSRSRPTPSAGRAMASRRADDGRRHASAARSPGAPGRGRRVGRDRTSCARSMR